MVINKLFKRISIFILSALIFVLAFSNFDDLVSANTPTPVSMEFNFLPDFVHYQGTISSINVPLEDIDTGVDPLLVIFSSQEQTLEVSGKPVNIIKGQFEFSTIFSDPIPGKYHIDIGPGVPHRLVFDVYVGGQKAKGAITFDPKPIGGCKIPNCFNVTNNLELEMNPFPTPTPVPPTPTPMPSVNPSLYSGEIRIGSSLIPDNIEVFAVLGDYESAIVNTKDGRFDIQLNPGTSNYLGVEFYLVVQGTESLTRYKFEPNQFTQDTNFLFPQIDLIIEEEIEPVLLADVAREPIVVATPTSTATVVPEIIEEEVAINVATTEGGGCGSADDGGGNSSVSIFSILIGMFIGFLYLKPKRA
jgi:hypothetical protein